ncbi:hypothetical protein [Micromonospora sp. U21]|uniref:hypothetical protein n=1 Tax=Micromonospora sp. U21 TaxID=2824899 RepID=UPI001B365F44|nr:hypothetical protein [Micromonospora sp. U21]MBQ0905896.1 hypothetical protein [Micromonospora sp. U21]
MEGIRDSAERAVRAGELINVRHQSIGYLSRIRREAMDEMVAAGLNHSQIADRTGLTRQRVGQLLAAPPAEPILVPEDE